MKHKDDKNSSGTHHEKHHESSHKKHDGNVHKTHKHHVHKRKDSSPNKIWIGISGVLLILLVISIFTHGFTFDNSSVDTIITQIDSISEASDNIEVQQKLDDAKDMIIEAKNIISIEDNLKVSEEKDDKDDKDKSDSTSTVTSLATKSDSVKLDFYVMSQCPYGVQVEDAIAPVLEKLDGYVDFNLDFIVTETGELEFKSLHGEPETKGNIAQLCAIKYEPENYMKLVSCMNENARNIPDNWETCAEDNDLDVDSIKECYETDEGKELLSASAKRATDANARGSPTIYLNDEAYSGGRTEEQFMRALCDELGYEPKACKELPEPTKVSVIAFTDSRCNTCDTTGIIGSLKSVFPGLDVETYDYDTKEGKKMYKELGLTVLPAILFDDSVKESEGYTNVQRFLTPLGDYQNLAVGAKFDPLKEICDNGEDDTDNGKVDCDDPDCKDSFTCREEIEEQLQVFIMSDCPYGRKAIEALKGVVDNFGDAMDFEVHYIATESGDGFSSLHGQYEVDENIIQLCTLEHSPKKWFDYMYCRSTKGVKGLDWHDCAEEADVDVEAVEECFDGEEGKELLKEDIKIAQSMGISASPTWLANNIHKFSGIDSETVKTNFCSKNPGLDGCENKLSTENSEIKGSC